MTWKLINRVFGIDKQDSIIRKPPLLQWFESAQRELAKFLEDNPERIDGFRMNSYDNSSCSPNYVLHTVRSPRKGKLFYIEERSPLDDWNSDKFTLDLGERIYTRRDWPDSKVVGYTAIEMAREIMHPKQRGIAHSDSMVGFSNPARNKLVKDIEEHTGINVKRAIRESSNS